ncbi:MAG: polyamine aminopropyltransferase, partial [Gammaproteobacteria bacterium]|nr:polyamine aminopropyltransferase [Gammaproteobacteria bacterium]
MKNTQFVENLHGEDAFQGFTVDEILYASDSPHQHIEILQTRRFGRALVLDGIVQTTEIDEFMYHEMLVHVPMFACESPREVLIVGGGDG